MVTFDLYSLPNSYDAQMVLHGQGMWKYKRDRKFQSGNVNGKEDLGDIGIDGKTILKWILGKYDLKERT
jgi:hypothetical protein